MQHPFLATRIGRIAFTAWWTVFAAIHAGILTIVYGIPLQLSIADALVSTLLISVLSLGLWFWVRFSDIEKTKPLTIILNHAGAAAISITALISIFNLLIPLFYSEEQVYLEFNNSSTPGRAILLTLVYILVTLIYYLIIYIQNYREKVLREAELNALFKDAELNWLKLQINPHFLFNSLNSVSSLTITEPQKAQEMIIRLSELLRYSLRQKPDSLVTLEEEIDNCVKYLGIEQVRFGSRLSYSIDISDDCQRVKVPGMIIQPLFENAIKHSVALSSDESMIEVKVNKSDDYVVIAVLNSVPSESSLARGTGVGLENIRRRLALMFGTSSLLTVKRNETHFIVTIKIPLSEI